MKNLYEVLNDIIFPNFTSFKTKLAKLNLIYSQSVRINRTDNFQSFKGITFILIRFTTFKSEILLNTEKNDEFSNNECSQSQESLIYMNLNIDTNLLRYFFDSFFKY